MGLEYKRIKKNIHNHSVEHRIIMEKHIKRKLLPEEIVHHIDGNKRNNKIENLLLLPNRAEHNKLHTGNKCPKGHNMTGANLVIRKNNARRCRKCHNATANIKINTSLVKKINKKARSISD